MFWKCSKRIFLDYAAGNVANPSALYKEGIEAKEKLTDARRRVAEVLNCGKEEIIFTSGGTEGNNLALLGVFEAVCAPLKSEFASRDSASSVGHESSSDLRGAHFVTTNIEHSSILETCKEIERRGGEVTIVPVQEDGIVDPKNIVAAIKANTSLVSVMYANNEIGTIQPIREIGRRIKELRKSKLKTRDSLLYPLFHTDACQAAQYLPLDVQKLGIDMMTLDGIKMYGPSAGLLYVKSGIHLHPIMFGGGQENGLRSGTENVNAIVKLSEALETCEKIKEQERTRLVEIRDYAIEKILSAYGRSPEGRKASLNGSRENRLPNNINICFPGTDVEFLVVALDAAGIAASYSSACQTLKGESLSYVIEALGKNCEKSSLRLTLGRESSKSDIDAFIVALKKIMYNQSK